MWGGRSAGQTSAFEKESGWGSWVAGFEVDLASLWRNKYGDERTLGGLLVDTQAAGSGAEESVGNGSGRKNQQHA